MSISNTYMTATQDRIWVKILIALVLIFVSFVFGILASSANPTLIALGVGGLGGIALIAQPKAMIWLLLLVGPIMGVMVDLTGRAFEKLPWAISLLGFLVLVPVLLKWISKEKTERPAFIYLSIVFVVYALVSTVFQFTPVPEYVSGFKRYFQGYGLMFALAVLPLTRKDIVKWQYLLLIYGFLQCPFALYERMILAPLRGNNASATDVVAGTFGAAMQGGSPNSTMLLFVLIVFAFLFSRFNQGLLTKKRLAIMSFVLLSPIGMGETKIALILIPWIWLTLIRKELIRTPFKYLPALIIGILGTGLLGYVYLVTIQDRDIHDVLENTISYNFENAGHGNLLLNRTTAITFWWQMHGFQDPIAFVFGHGLGSSFSGGITGISGHIGGRYSNYGIDITAAPTILWDLGAFGLFLYLSIFFSAWHAVNKLVRNAVDPVIHADAIALQAIIPIFIIYTFYTKSGISLNSLEIIMSAILGYLAFLIKEQKSLSREEKVRPI